MSGWRGIGDVDYLDAVVVDTCDQRVVAVAYNDRGDAVVVSYTPSSVVKACCTSESDFPSDADAVAVGLIGIGDVDYLDAVVDITLATSM